MGVKTCRALVRQVPRPLPWPSLVLAGQLTPVRLVRLAVLVPGPHKGVRPVQQVRGEGRETWGVVRHGRKTSKAAA